MSPIGLPFNPFMPTGFNICCPRDCVSRHNGGTSGALIMPRDAVSRTANIETHYNIHPFRKLYINSHRSQLIPITQLLHKVHNYIVIFKQSLIIKLLVCTCKLYVRHH